MLKLTANIDRAEGEVEETKGIACGGIMFINVKLELIEY
jgi:hypothetical protein